MIRFYLILLFSVNIAFAQSYNPLLPPNTYRNKDNPNYWKNKLPHAGYWQQDVHYTIKANIDETTDIIEGVEKLVYWNNSPHQLNYVFFHLYQNAFQPDSYYDKLQKSNYIAPNYGKYEIDKKGTEVMAIQVNGKDVKVELDNTILKVYLPSPLPPNESITFDIEFKTYYGDGGVGRRMKKFDAYGNTHYDGVHWYPRIAVYDRKFGWDTDQHLGKEFYGDFGTYDVDLTFSSNYVVEATGFMINRDEMLPSDLRQKLDISNFVNKPWESPPSVIIPYDKNDRKTWKFHAENVHDFAFTADPTYRIGEAEWDGIKCYALVQEPHAAGWRNAADYTAKIIQTFSEEIGRYTYHKMIVADARDGMEYPMLTLDGGFDPNYRGLLVHEIGHNWFFGQVGTNETYRAALDEGFTQFLTSWGLEKIEGDTLPKNRYLSSYKTRFKSPELVRYQSVYFAYLNDAIRNLDPPLNTHSDDFNGALGHGGGYRQVYYKTATMLYNLQYVLGDEIFIAAMQNYFSTWKIAHPYMEDFRNSIIQFTKVDLNWFFDQWFETTKSIDYKVGKIRKTKEKDTYKITFKRKGTMQMPIDFSVTAKDGKNHDFYIPNTWYEKQTNATVLPRWIGWGKLQPTYQAVVTIPSGIQQVRIDTTNRLADINMLNNSSHFPLKMSFDHRIYNRSDNRYYELFARPDLWYNGFDGLKTGVHFNGNYMRYKHLFDANLWFNTGLFKQVAGNDFNLVNYRLNYRTPLEKVFSSASVFMSSMRLDGLFSHTLGFDKKFNGEKTNVYVYFKSMYRPQSSDLKYLFSNNWDWGMYNNTINVGIDKNYRRYKNTGSLAAKLTSTSLGSDYDYAYLNVSWINEWKTNKINFRNRLVAQYGWGELFAPESKLFFAGANPEEMMENKYMRSVGIIPQEWGGYGATTNFLQFGGGLNMRGYAGYLVPHQQSDGTISYVYSGTTGAALNMELEFNKLIGFKPKDLSKLFGLTTYLFGDVGIINYESATKMLVMSELRADAGIGSALTIKKFGALEMVEPLVIRFDVPFYLSHVPYLERNNIDFRFLVSINRAF
jgi:hypothetical protein